MKLRLLIIALITASQAQAQFVGSFVEKRFCSSPDGNYIFLLDEEYMIENNGLFPEPYKDGRFFIIERSENGGTFEEIDELKPIQNRKELEAIFGDGIIEALISDTLNFNLKTEQDVLDLYKNSNSQFGRLFLEPIKQLRAMGHAYLDTKVDAGKTYSYRIKWQDTQRVILEGSVVSGTSNKILDQIKLNFNQNSIASIDSLISGSWLQTGILNKMAYNVHFYGKKTLDQEFKMVDSRRINYSVDTLKANVRHKVKPNEVWDIFAVPVDVLGNEGSPSDTATIAAFSKAFLPYPKNFNAKDTTNAIRLTWTPATQHSYLSAYMISREIADKYFEILDTIPLDQTEYWDYNVADGVSYNYEIQAIAGPINNLRYKDFPSVRAAGTHLTQERTLPPDSVGLSMAGQLIKIEWEPVLDTNVISYFVYSSLSADADEYETIGSVEANQSFLIDSTNNGDFQYQTRYYAVRTMGYNMKLSDLSNIVSITPNHNPTINEPIGLTVRRWTEGNKLNWETQDISADFISSFNIYRRGSELEPLILIDSLVKVPDYLDQSADRYRSYEYAVTSVGINGSESDFSVPTSINQEEQRITDNEDHLTSVSYKNIPPGIEINWLWSKDSAIEKVIIYRLLANSSTNQEYEKVGEVNVSERRFWDKNVSEGATYMYMIAVEDPAGNESEWKFNELISREIEEE